MATAAHTPGPWNFKVWMTSDEDTERALSVGLQPVRALTNEGQRFIMAPHYRVALVDCQTDFKRGKGYQTDCAERDANARLIAAAPELLDACNRAEWWFSTIPNGQAMRDVMRAVIAKATGAA